MKAIVLDRYGEPDVLELREVEKPSAGPGQVLVKVHATAVNDWDYCFVRGKPFIYRLLFGLTRPKVKILGAEVAGTVEAVGEGVTAFRAGDRVYGDLSEAGFGGFAEYVATRETALSPMPPGLSFEEAAAVPHAAMLAYQGLVGVAKIREGEKVLINGAGGGVGVLGLRIAKRFGAQVTGVDAAEKLDAMKSLGFDHVLDYRARSFTEDGERYDLILDTKSTRSPMSLLGSLNPGGRYVTVGGDVLRLLQIASTGGLISAFSGKGIRLLALEPNQGLAAFHELAGDDLELPIDGPYPLAEVPRALRRFGEAVHFGKVVITVAA